MKEYYKVKNKRLNRYLYSLGFNSIRIPLKVDESKESEKKYIYLFEDSALLRKAITFYTEFKKEIQQK